MPDLYVQVELERQTATGLQQMVVWLPTDDPPFKVGQEISLRGETERWRVARKFLTLPRQVLHRDWKCGGLA